MSSSLAQRISLSLISHTNAGKTTLARTLLQRDIGEVRDAPHVTEFAEDHLLVRSDEGDELRLWDTPGFGDTVRLVRRLKGEGTALGWFLSEVWDRWRDRPFWANQQALRHVRERTDVVLYLVNAAESTEAAAYVQPEMQLLAWMGKPIVVLLNQLGAQRSPEHEAADVQRWRQHLQAWPLVAQVLPMDAFARCWVQEGALLQAVAAVLPPPAQEPMRRMQQAWWRQRLQVFERSTASLARRLAHIACTRVPVDNAGGLGEAAKQLTARVGAWLQGADAKDDATQQARRTLLALLDEQVRDGTGELLALHGLDGAAQGEILARVAQQIEVSERIDEGRAAVWGGMLSGALAGLKADIASGGLTLGGGLLAGGLLGALGAAGLARGINVMRGGGPPWVGWSGEALGPIVEAGVLRYLAVAHFGRGRGQWAQGEAPAHWQALVAEVMARHAAALEGVWRIRSARRETDAAAQAAAEAQRVADALQLILDSLLREVLSRLYPLAAPDLQGSGGSAQSGP